MERHEESPNERITRPGEKLIQVLEHEEDHVVELSALALVTAAGCSSLAGEVSDQLESVAEGSCAHSGTSLRETSL